MITGSDHTWWKLET